MRLLRDPLLHFLVGGGLMFAAWWALNPSVGSDDPRRIVVDRAALLTFMQLRSQAFDATAAEARLAALTPEALGDLVDEYVREQALYRSALELGLEQDDYVIKRRLVQKVEYMAEGVAADLADPPDDVLADWYGRHRNAYAEPERITLTHVFFSASRHGTGQAAALARAALAELNRTQVAFSGATAFGERFPYHANYVAWSRDEIAGHFGAAMTAELFDLPADPARWQGVFASAHGSHAVLVLDRTPERFPELGEVRERVLRDYRAERARERRDAFIRVIVARYRTELAADLPIERKP
ncbi:MAG: peptidylprolyl isomerase [Pseudomonadales bacterium]